MRFTRVLTLLTLTFALLAEGQAQTFPVNVIVPGNSDPFLAGQPDGVAAKSDTAPDESPVFATSVASGDVLTFTVTGSVSFAGGNPTAPPDGAGTYSSASALGIAGYVNLTIPIDALVGVFLGDEVPSDPAPTEITYPAEELAYTLLAPEVHQIFYIGDGLTGNGEGDRQQIVVPSGATRLFLGTSDGFGWYNNSGEFEVTINRIGQNPNQALVGPTTIRFDQPSYTFDVGSPVAGEIMIDPVPLGGLYSQGMIITVREREGALAGVVTPVLNSILNFDGPLPDESGAISVDQGVGGLKGSALFSTARQTLNQPSLGTFTVADLPPGIYDLAIQPWNELGPTEDIFVTGHSATLDEFITFEPSTMEIIGALLPEISVSGPITLQRQTGLFEQRLTLVNNTGRVINGFRLFIIGLPEGVVPWNAHGVIDGVPYIDIFTDLAPGESMEVVLEYYRPNRGSDFSPTFEIAEPGESPFIAGERDVLNLDLRVIRKDGAGLILEFLSEADQPYLIEYSDDMAAWKVSHSPVMGTGQRIQWLDGGPPKTDSFPSGNRFYRLTEQ